jgi:hypothetical protein
LGTSVAGNKSPVERQPIRSLDIREEQQSASKNQTGRRGETGHKRQAGSTQSKNSGRKAGKRQENGDVRTGQNLLERGDLFFFYRPDVDETAPQGLLDVRRFHVVLRPEGKETLRLITIGRKKLPDAADEGRSHWGFVDRVFRNPEELRTALSGAIYETETLGERHLPEARPAGEGVYALARHGRSTILAYALELPEQPGEVQEAFNITPEGRFVLAIKNPDAGSPAGVGLDDRRADFPEELRERFGDRRWAAADPPEFLDCEGAELVLIGGRDEAAVDLGIDLEPQPEDEKSAEVFKDLHLERSERAVKPLFEGRWK